MSDNDKDQEIVETKNSDEESKNVEIIDEVPSAPGWSKKDIRRNMILLIMLNAIFELGWDDFQVALTPFLAWLKMPNVWVGVVQGLTIMTLPGLFLSPFISHRFPIKKYYAFWSNIVYLGMLGVLGFAVVFADNLGFTRETLVWVVLVTVGLHQLFAGFVSVPVNEYVAACIPMSFRGRYNGFSNTSGGIIGLVSTGIGTALLAYMVKPRAFGILILMTWAICSIGYIVALFAKEKPVSLDKVPKAWSKDMIKSVWDNKPFVRIMLCTLISTMFIGYANNFVQIYGFRELHMAAYNSGVFMYINLILRLMLSVPAGLYIDRVGPKKIMGTWPYFTALGLIFPIFIHNKWGIYLNVLNGAIFFQVWTLSRSVLLLGLAKPEHRAGNFTIQILISNFAMFFGPIFIGKLCDIIGYQPTFIYSAIAALCTIPLWRWAVSILSDDPKAYG